MRIIFRILILFTIIKILTGCGDLYSGHSIKSVEMGTDSPYINLTHTPQAGLDGNEPLIGAYCCSSGVSDPATLAGCTTQRNMAVAALVIASEEACLTHHRSMYGQDAAWNIGLGTLTNVFAGAASVVSAERPKSVLAALALFSNSERSLINETAYKQMLISAVDKKNLLLLKAERSLEKDANGAQAKGLGARITAVNAALQAEELR